MGNEQSGKELEKSVRVLKDVSTSIVTRGLEDLAFLAEHTPAEFLVQKGNACYVSEDYQQAVIYYTQAIKLDKQNGEAYDLRGKSYHEMDKFDLSLADCHQSMMLNSLDIIWCLECAIKHIEDGRYDLAIKLCEIVLTINNNDILALQCLAFSLKQLHKYSDELKIHNRIIKIRQTSDTFLGRGLALFNLKKYSKSIIDFDKSISLNTGNHYSYLYRGSALVQIGEIQKGFSDIDKALQLHPKFPDAYAERGTLYANSHQYEKAISDFSDAVKLSPNAAFFYKWRGICHARLERYALAIEDYKKAIELDISDPQIHQDLRIAYSHLSG